MHDKKSLNFLSYGANLWLKSLAKFNLNDESLNIIQIFKEKYKLDKSSESIGDSLIQNIKDYLLDKKNIGLNLIDDYNLNGDYIESKAFGYLAIRSFLSLPISYPKTTRCKTPSVGGKLAENF